MASNKDTIIHIKYHNEEIIIKVLRIYNWIIYTPLKSILREICINFPYQALGACLRSYNDFLTCIP